MTGRTVSHYRVLEKLGGGGMGVVYKAEDINLKRQVALKFLSEDLYKDPKALERFEREARSAALLNHPNICGIYEIEEDEGKPVLVMEYLEGDPLSKRIGGQPMDVRDLVGIAVQVASALQSAHEQGIIHRDIKPGNIFLTKLGPKVLDFGLAKIMETPPADAVADETATGLPYAEDPISTADQMPGTAMYMSPEQVRGDEIDPRTDIFSFGSVLYEMATGTRPFRGRNVVLTLHAILHRKPLSPRQLNPRIPPRLETVIGKALEKDRNKRYQSARELQQDLEIVQRELDLLAAGGKLPGRLSAGPTSTFRTPGARRSRYIQVALATALLLAIVAIAALWKKRGPNGGTVHAGLNTVAVLPFQNASRDPKIDFLRFALADEVASSLTYSPNLEVRPVSSSEKYGGADPQQAGKALHVATVLDGHFLQTGETTRVTLEAVDVESNRLLWKGEVSAPTNDLTPLQDKLATLVRRELLPVLGVSSVESATRPRNAEAYDLYLRTVAEPHDPQPNKEAIKQLEKAVGLDPTYAPAWDALGRRYYYDASYAGGGRETFAKSNAAHERAFTLDPNFTPAAAHLARNWVEQGELAKAYQKAQELVKLRPKSAEAHFTLAYVLRYGGLLQASAKECELAVGLDPGNFVFRSCSLTFAEQGEADRAMDYLRLDAGSEWVTNIMPSVLLRQGKTDEAREAAAKVTRDTTWFGDIARACLDGHTGEAEQLAHSAAPLLLGLRDPELKYHHATMLAYCGHKDLAIQLLQSSIGQGYCAAEALDKDPLLEKLRGDPQFQALKDPAQQCAAAIPSGN